MSSDANHQFIVIEGPIGVGKTSLARKLCESLSAEAVLEQASQNPFLERFYRNPRVGALPAQLYFLFQRAQQLAELKQQDLFARVRVADYLLEKDRLFARVTLDEAEYGLYDQVYAKLDIQTPKPDLVVYLQAPVDVLIERIAKRGINYEQHIEKTYLEKLNEAYARFFHEYEAAPLLIVNAASIDPVNNQSDYDELLAAIRRMKKGRLYYNPLRSRSI
jgi:deoxyguanosine kinase